MQQLPGFAVAGEEGKVYLLRKALYGLLQAPCAWNAKLDATLKYMGFQQSTHEATMYRQGSGCSVLLVGIYVDDLIITGVDEQKVEAFKAQMMKIFDMSDLSLLSFCLSVEVHLDASGITLRQTWLAAVLPILQWRNDCGLVGTARRRSTPLITDVSSAVCATWCTLARTWHSPSGSSVGSWSDPWWSTNRLSPLTSVFTLPTSRPLASKIPLVLLVTWPTDSIFFCCTL